MTVICEGCGARHDDVEGVTHKYMLSSPGCWAQYGELLVREYQSPALFAAAHRFSVDAYALQHPGIADDRRAYQSVHLHYCSLHLIFSYGRSHAEATRAMQKLAQVEFEPLPERVEAFDITVADLAAADEADHARTAKRWAKAAYEAWACLEAFAGDAVANYL